MDVHRSVLNGLCFHYFYMFMCNMKQHEVNTWEASAGTVQMFFGYEGTKIASFLTKDIYKTSKTKTKTIQKSHMLCNMKTDIFLVASKNIHFYTETNACYGLAKTGSKQVV